MEKQPQSKKSRGSSQSNRQPIYDTTLKGFIEGREAKILPHLVKGVEYVETLNVEVLRPPLRADRVYSVRFREKAHILHLEYETSPENDLDARLDVYNSQLYYLYKKRQ